jgi:hypothetical protein
MALSITLDWLAFTYKDMSREAAKWIQLRASAENSVDCAPTNGYRAAYRTTQGIVIMWNLDRSEMGYHVIISGSAIRNIIDQQNVDQKTLLGEVCNTGASITRLDLAKDAQDAEISLDAIYGELESGRYTGTARTVSQLHSPNGGNTVYIGSRQSEKFIRIYDKAAQENLHDRLWCRFELECKGMVARALAVLLAKTDRWQDAFNEIALGMVDIEHSSDWKQFFMDESVPIGMPKLEKKSDREAWIASQVTPAVVKHFIEHADSKAVQWLRKTLDLIESQRKLDSGHEAD